MSRDANHESVGRWLRQRGAKTVDLHRIGKGCPDWLAGYAGVERLLEVKEPRDERPKPERKRWSSRCAQCGKAYRHRNHTTGPMPERHPFVRQLVKAPERDGVVKARQAAFHREWAGHSPVVVRTEQDVESLLEEMAAEGEMIRKFRESEGRRARG